jgi:hypothetical protein
LNAVDAIISFGKSSLDHTHSVCNIERIVVLAQSDVALLQTTGSDESIDLFAFDAVKIPNGSLDLTLVRLNINNEDQGVAVFNQLHRGLRGQRVLNDRVLVQSVLLGHTLFLVHRLAVMLKSLGLVKVHLCVNGGALLRDALLQGLRDGCCFTYNRNEDQRVMQGDEKECQKGTYTESYTTTSRAV